MDQGDHRPADGAIIDAKHVRQQGCSPRTLDGLQQGDRITQFLSPGDANELGRYQGAISNPNNHAQYLEIDTDDPETVGYWQFLAAQQHVTSDVRYEPWPGLTNRAKETSMSNERIIVAAEPGTDWPLSLVQFAGQLRTRWPDARTWTQRSPITNADDLAFEVGTDEDARSGAYFEHQQLDLSDGTPDDWADTIAWFLRLLPATSRSVCLLPRYPSRLRCPARPRPPTSRRSSTNSTTADPTHCMPTTEHQAPINPAPPPDRADNPRLHLARLAQPNQSRWTSGRCRVR